jgi:uncharacterized protein YwbE
LEFGVVKATLGETAKLSPGVVIALLLNLSFISNGPLKELEFGVVKATLGETAKLSPGVVIALLPNLSVISNGPLDESA